MKLLSVLNVLVRIACTMPNNAKVDVITELSVRRRCGHSPNTFVHLFFCAELDEEGSQTADGLLGMIIVAESRFTRSPQPRACQLSVITSAELSGREVRERGYYAPALGWLG